MSQVRNSIPGFTLPAADPFRVWLRSSLEILNIRPQRMSLDLDLSRNFIGQFLRDPARDISLSNASRIAARVHNEAIEAGQDLPEMVSND